MLQPVKRMPRRVARAARAAVAIGVLSAGAAAQAAPVLGIDLDPGLVGVQGTRTVLLGTTFTVDVVLSDDGTGTSPTVFDTALVEAFFDDAGPVLALGPGGALAGAIAASSAATIDLQTFSIVSAGDALGAGPSEAPTAGTVGGLGPFAAGTGRLGLLSLFALGGTPFEVGPADGAVSLFSFDLTASAVGTSTVLAAAVPGGGPALAYTPIPGGPVTAYDPGLMAGVVEVVERPTDVPEPGSLALVAVGLLALPRPRGRTNLSD
ncbi:MAG: hypothetical protein H6983_01440 [Ectothiorhodospiraceae bacterium]|nr:hypothetical protein [Ectothiorhodospiraceae bacterium]